MKPRVVVLIPWRPGSKVRERNWGIARPYIENLGFPIFLGDKEGPWRRAAAINAAADEAGGWDIAVIADADTIPDPEATHAAIKHVQRTKGGARPHDHLWRLTQRGTRIIAGQGPGVFDRWRHTSGLFRGGGLLVVHRVGWDTVGGFDESYIGWGYEDSAFNVALLTQVDWDRLPGVALHLWHEPASQTTPECRENKARYRKLYVEFGAEIARAHEEKLWGPEKIL